ncbi:EAL domain-containing protein [Sediminispirochaeta bajacaliforniensis]|uniref:EAL domain-containing protein n=1 Tax=Sediminispirochaeta bajacaliforniensis TaxID=148 RepID=UPI0003755B2F|nr:EAL domain-containing protein [Sediminispirochaeta bajacaliforniensis]
MRNEKILIVEDERIIALDLQRRLERFGYPEPILAATGDEALRRVEEHRPDIILMDIMLSGGIDGVDAAKVVKERFGIPVIFLTAYSDEKTLSRAKEAEPFGYILKPFKEKELYTTIDIALYKFNVDQALKRQEHWLSAILHSIEDGIIATGKDGKIQFMNPVAENITGWKENEATERTLGMVFQLYYGPDETAVAFPNLLTDGEESPFVFKNCILKNRAGATIHTEGSLAAIRDREDKLDGQVLAFRDTTEMRRMSETISYQASHDTLTGLINRDEFSEQLRRTIGLAKESGSENAFIFLDIDQFKVVNDLCGHTAGDELLLKTTTVIKSVVRSSDLSARLGGDEFGILLTGASINQATEIAQRLQSRLRETKLIWDKHVFNITTSIGIVMINGNDQDIHDVFAAADDACYIAKDAGGNKIKVYNVEENLFTKRRGEMQWISRLTKALEEDRFQLFFQPIEPINSSNSGMKKCELLIRMIDQEGNTIMPADFIPAAERYNLMPAVDRWVVQNAFKAYKLLSDELGQDRNPFFFTINLSGAFLADETSLDFLVYEFQEYGVPPSAFCFEVTETEAISNMKTASHFINELKKIGSTFALDDFGSGFSSFNYLKLLPVDYLKIDGMFVKDMDTDPVNRAMVEAINSMGKVMRIKTIAEFVGNEGILRELEQIGVDYAQGYFFGKPTPIKMLHPTAFG